MNIQQQRKQLAIESILRNQVYLPESALYKMASKSLGKLSCRELAALVVILGMKSSKDFIRSSVPVSLEELEDL